VRLGDAVWNMNRTALIVSAFATQDYAALDGLFDDKLHQPRRSRILTPLFGVIAAARKAGALGAFLSGSGSAIMALALDREAAIGAAMRERLAKHGIESSVLVLTADNQGIQRG
ncbi:MAG: homoserine kinase, partial [Planctomycetes bacterium]|nr:homoserine kinase [Planctomycetota bacterium]